MDSVKLLLLVCVGVVCFSSRQANGFFFDSFNSKMFCNIRCLFSNPTECNCEKDTDLCKSKMCPFGQHCVVKHNVASCVSILRSGTRSSARPSLGSLFGSSLRSPLRSPVGPSFRSPVGSPLGPPVGSPLGPPVGSPLGSPLGSPTGSSNSGPPCLDPVNVGPCKGAIRRFFFNKFTRRCEIFLWGGCEPNRNNFISFQQCAMACASFAG